jgi:hypothetical protein
MPYLRLRTLGLEPRVGRELPDPIGQDGTVLDLSGPLVLDGGLSTALEQQGADLGGALWTARLLADEPARIAAAHRSFFYSFSSFSTTSSYHSILLFFFFRLLLTLPSP